MIHILHHQEDRLVDILSNAGARLYWDDTHEMDVDGLSTHQFTCLAKSTAAQYLEKRARYIFPAEEEGYYHEMIVMEAVTRNGLKQVYSKASYQDINTQRIVEPQSYNAWTLAQFVAHALLNTEWTVGTVEYSGIRSESFDSYLGAYEFLKQIKTLFDHEFEMRFRVVTDGNTIIGRYVDLVEAVGEDNKKEIVYAKDLLGIEKTVYNERIVTQLIALGPELQDGTRLQVTVSDEEAFQRWNRNGYHITDIYTPESNDQNMTLARLTSLANVELSKRVDSVVEYQIDAITIEQLFPHERVRLGDRIRVKDEEFIPPLYAEARVIRVLRSLTDEDEKSYTVGEFVEYTSDDLFKAFKEMQTVYGMKVIQSDVAPTGNGQLVWIDTSQEPNVPHTWNGTSWVKFSPTAAVEIGAETPQGASDKADAAGEAAAVASALDATAKADAAEQAAVDAAALDAQTKATAAETAAKNYALEQDNAIRQDFSTMESGTTIVQSATAPASPVLDDLWIDISTDPYTWKRYNGTAWINAVSTSLSELNGTLATNQIALAAITSDLIADGAVTATELGTDSVTNAKIAIGAVNSDEIAVNAITSDKILANAIIAGKLGVGAVIAESIAAGSISSNMIATIGLDAAVVKFGTMSGDRIFANTLDANRLKAGSIIADNIIFSGTLQGADGTFSGSVIIGSATVGNGGVTVANGMIQSEKRVDVSAGVWHRQEARLLSGYLEFIYEDLGYSLNGIASTSIAMYQNGLAVEGDLAVQGNLSAQILNPLTLIMDGTGYVNLNPTGLVEVSGGLTKVFSVSRRPEFAYNALFSQGADFNGDVDLYASAYFHGAINRVTSTEFTSAVQETGFCGIGAMTATINSATSAIAGVGVNYRMKKTYVPSTISLSGTSSNIVNSGHVLTIDISVNGFWLYVLAGTASVNVFRYWRGSYTA